MLKIKHKSGTQTNEILRNLTEITIHVNGDDKYNPLYYKQFPALSNLNGTVSPGEIKKFLDKCCKEYIVTLNLVGDFSTYKDRKQLFEWMRNTQLNRYNLVTSLRCWLSYSCAPLWSYRDLTIGFTVIIEDMELFETTDLTDYLYWQDSVTFCFPVGSEQEYNKAIVMIENKKIKLFVVVPIFNGNNIDFFKKYVYITLSDVKSPGFNKRKIFSNQVINNFFFGKLIILPDKKVYANVNFRPVGEMKDSIYSIIFKELDQGFSWRMIRDKKPCADCLYQWLCPSPSNYELLIGKQNLCTII